MFNSFALIIACIPSVSVCAFLSFNVFSVCLIALRVNEARVNGVPQRSHLAKDGRATSMNVPKYDLKAKLSQNYVVFQKGTGN